MEKDDPYIYNPGAAELQKLVKQRLQDLYAGNFEKLFSQKIVIDNLNCGMGGLPIGDISKIPDAKMLLYKSTIENSYMSKDLKSKSLNIDQLIAVDDSTTTKDSLKKTANDSTYTKK